MNIRIEGKTLALSRDIINLSKLLQDLEYDEIEITEFTYQDVCDFFNNLNGTKVNTGQNLDQMMRMCLYFQTDDTQYIKQILLNKNTTLFEKYKECIYTNKNIFTFDIFYNYIIEHNVIMDDKYNFMKIDKYILYDGKYNYDERIQKYLIAEKNFVQANGTDQQTMLYFFGPIDSIKNTICKILNDMDSYELLYDNRYWKEHLFIKTKNMKTLVCILTYMETLQECKLNAPFHYYYDGFNTYYEEDYFLINSYHHDLNYSHWWFIEGNVISQSVDVWLANLSNKIFAECTISHTKKTIKSENYICCDHKNVKITIADDQFNINDTKICWQISKTITCMIRKMIYIMIHIKKLRVKNLDILYDSKKAYLCNTKDELIMIQFISSFDVIDNVLIFKDARTNLMDDS